MKAIGIAALACAILVAAFGCSVVCPPQLHADVSYWQNYEGLEHGITKVTVFADDMGGGLYLLNGNPAIVGWVRSESGGGVPGAGTTERRWELYLDSADLPCALALLWVDGAQSSTCEVVIEGA